MVDLKAAVESLYVGTCTVIGKVGTPNEMTKRTTFEDATLFTNQPCRVSFESVNAVGDGNIAQVSQAVKLFISNSISIQPGAMIVVTQNGVTTKYRQSGEPSIYSSHQEIPLELADKQA